MLVEIEVANDILGILYDNHYSTASSYELSQSLGMQVEEVESILVGMQAAIPILIEVDKVEQGCYIRIKPNKIEKVRDFLDMGGFFHRPDLLNDEITAAINPQAIGIKNTWIGKHIEPIIIGLIVGIIILILSIIAHLRGLL